MTLIYQNPARANVVMEAVAGNVTPATTAYQVAVAYVTREGARTLVHTLRERAGESWAGIPKTIITCFDFGHTEPGALDYLREQGFRIRIANLGADGGIRLMSNPSSFHPKLYFASTGISVLAVVGSANLSRRALTVNAEAVTSIQVDIQEAARIWDVIAGNSVALTPELLEAYRRVRTKLPAAPTLDEPPVPAPVAPGTLPIFRDVVEAKAVFPAEHLAFWVEVGGPSGGSGNQLELPRQAQRFFGYSFDDYDGEHHVIGEPTLISPKGSWECRLTWHGNNGMERINLPTTVRSGLSYAHQVVLFQRSDDSFQLTVDAPDGARAQRWREESGAAGTLYRFSSGSSRRCGLI
jgi:HKD family nuclease